MAYIQFTRLSCLQRPAY